MNARVLVVADGTHAADLAAAILIESMGVKPTVFDEDDEPRVGIMEFFDWLAGTRDSELHRLASDIEDEFDRNVALGALLCNNREAAGLVVWRNM